MSKRFLKALKDRNHDPEGRRWLFLSYDQLHAELGPLGREDPEELGVVLVETSGKAGRRLYHRQKLALILANQRHFALELADRGIAVRYEFGEGAHRDVLAGVAERLGPLRVMRPAERELRADLRGLFADGSLEEIKHEGWLTSFDLFWKTRRKDETFRMDSFYRRIRKATGLLMTAEGKPIGDRWSFDDENRKPWKGEPAEPALPNFEVDEITQEVGALIEDRYSDHPGALDLAHLPATAADAEALWEWAREECLEFFGPFEDAMAESARNLFHTRISSVLNLHRLLPQRLIDDVAEMDIPLNSKEGFLRQVIGWREFVHHIHEATDGFRREAAPPTAIAEAPAKDLTLDDGARPSALDSDAPLPEAFWGEESGLNCLDTVVSSVWEEGYSHHITRLMVLSNLATLLDVSPRELTDWFWVAYVDAYDWVVEPNVLAMGTFATGPLMTTKPYVAGSAYIHKMSDYCASCRFHPKKDCPITPLYWAFLERHREVLDGNPRMALVMKSLERRDGDKKSEDREVYEEVRKALAAGRSVPPRKNQA